MLRLMLAAALLSTPVAASPTIVVDRSKSAAAHGLSALQVHVGGRVVVRPGKGGASSYVHGWPGVYFEGAFRGARVVLRFDDESNEYRLLIDDRPPVALARPGRADVMISGLGDGPHRLRLETVTEGPDHPGTFGGFFVPRGETPLAPPAPRARRIEFIGDSSMSGYGARSATRQCTQEEARLLSDTQDAYPALVARHEGADYQVNAISGRGLVRNYAGSMPDQPLPAVYPYAMPDRSGGYADDAWRPQIIVIKLNADFVGAYGPTERWKTAGEIAPAYIAGYETFLATLHQLHPRAAILIWWFDVPGTANVADLTFVRDGAARLRTTASGLGIPFIDFLPMRDLGYDRAACDSHPSLADHRKTAAWLQAYLDAHSALWEGKPAGPTR